MLRNIWNNRDFKLFITSKIHHNVTTPSARDRWNVLHNCGDSTAYVGLRAQTDTFFVFFRCETITKNYEIHILILNLSFHDGNLPKSYPCRVRGMHISPEVRNAIHVGDRILEINGLPVSALMEEEVLSIFYHYHACY